MITKTNAVAIGESLKEGHLNHLNVDKKILVDSIKVLGDSHELSSIILGALDYYNRSLLNFIDYENACKAFIK